MLSQAGEDYLKKIYKLQTDRVATTSEIANVLNVTSASVTNMLKRLANMGFVEYTSYKGVKLTDSGKKVSLKLIRKHRLLELFLHKILDYSWDQVHDEAEALEHHISARFEEQINKLLNYPSHDPHGDPIPTKDGVLPKSASISLSQIEGKGSFVIDWVGHDDPELLRYLEKLGLLPGVNISVVKIEPYGGPYIIKVKNEQKMVGVEAAKSIHVLPIQ